MLWYAFLLTFCRHLRYCTTGSSESFVKKYINLKKLKESHKHSVLFYVMNFEYWPFVLAHYGLLLSEYNSYTISSEILDT